MQIYLTVICFPEVKLAVLALFCHNLQLAFSESSSADMKYSVVDSLLILEPLAMALQ